LPTRASAPHGRADVLVGPGLLGGSTILSLEQMILDVEIFRRCRRMHSGISVDAGHWLEDVIHAQGPGGSFVGQKSTLQALRDGSFYLSGLGFHDTHEKWKAAGMPDANDELRDITRETLGKHQPLPLDPAVQKELETLARRMRAADA